MKKKKKLLPIIVPLIPHPNQAYFIPPLLLKWLFALDELFGDLSIFVLFQMWPKKLYVP